MPTPTQPQTNSAQSNANYTPPLISAAIPANSPRGPEKSYHISDPPQEDLCGAANFFSTQQPV